MKLLCRLWRRLVNWFHRQPEPSKLTAVEVPPFGAFDADALFSFRHPRFSELLSILDPWVVHKRLKEFGGGDAWADAIVIMEAADNATKMGVLIDQAQANRLRAFSDLADLSRKVFGLKTIDDVGALGWSDAEAFLLLAAYLRGVAELASEFLPLPKQLARPAA